MVTVMPAPVKVVPPGSGRSDTKKHQCTKVVTSVKRQCVIETHRYGRTMTLGRRSAETEFWQTKTRGSRDLGEGGTIYVDFVTKD